MTTTTLNELRPYQIEALEAVGNRTVSRGLVAMPTGSGKGHITRHLPEVLDTDSILFLAHREELINQLYDHVTEGMQFWDVDIEQSTRRANPEASTVIASVPTLTACGDARLHSFSPNHFDAIVVDEAHHSTAETYLRIWQHFGLLDEDKKKVDNPPIPLIGLTATPARGDKVGLCNVFDEIIYQYTLEQAIRDGWLVPIYAYTVKTRSSLDNVRVRAGSYVEKDLAAELDTYDRNAVVVQACQEHANGLKTLVFCVDIKHSLNLAGSFQDNGRAARSISGNLSRDERAATLEWFNRTPGAVLTNCQIVSEGVDIPSVECVVMARPTKSKTLYAQCLGRGTRLARGAHDIEDSRIMGKDRMILLDITDCVSDIGHRAVNISDIFGTALPDKPLTGQNVLQALEEQQKEVEEAALAPEGTEAIAVDLFAKPKAVNGSQFLWLGLGDAYRLNLGADGTVTIEPNALDQWVMKFRPANRRLPHRLLGPMIPERSDAVEIAESWIEQNYPNRLALVMKGARWRKDPPSEKQLDLCRKLQIPVPENATKGDVSTAIDRHFAQNKRG